MKENKKTLLFCAIAGACLLLAIFTIPKESVDDPNAKANRLLIKNFTKSDRITSISIASFDHEEVRHASVELIKGEADRRWYVHKLQNKTKSPRQIDYPVEAEQKIAEATTRLMNVKILKVASNKSPKAGDHERFGVEKPDPKSLLGTGTGTLVTIKTTGDRELCKLIIGYKAENNPDNYYVRLLSGDEPNRVYIVKLDNENSPEFLDLFQPNFNNWVEENLLDVRAADIKKVVLKDYSYTARSKKGTRLALEPNLRSILSFSTNAKGKTHWKIDSLQQYNQQKKLVPASLQSNEAFNEEALDLMKSALANLSIVDVDSKNFELAAFLQTENSVDKIPLKLSGPLAVRGYYLAKKRPQGNEHKLLSGDGELVVSTNSGIEYVLRFGNMKGLESKKRDTKRVNDPTKLKKTRYLFITARFKQNLIDPPKQKPLPSKLVLAAAKPAGIKSTDNKPRAPEPKDEDDNNEKQLFEAKKQAAIRKALMDKYEKNLATVKKENEEAIKKYNGAVISGKQKVRMLKYRFSNWYYVISDDTYHKIHLSRKDILRKKMKIKKSSVHLEDTELSIRKISKPGEFTLPRRKK